MLDCVLVVCIDNSGACHRWFWIGLASVVVEDGQELM